MRKTHIQRLLAACGVSVALTFATMWGATAAEAQQPSLMIATAPLVDPTTGLSYYGVPTSPAPPTTRDPLIQEQARALRYNIDNIFSYVRDNVETIPIFGVQEGARGIVLNGRGTAFDQAQFMVDALREADAVTASTYSPKYVFGTITIPTSQALNWFNVADSGALSRLLAAGGIPATVGATNTSMLHVWVQATIGGTQYLFDPSYKTYTARGGTSWQSSVGYTATDLLTAGGGGTGATISNFNQTAFRSKLNTYRGNVEAFLAANGLGKRADVIIGTRDIVAHPSSENRRTTLSYATTSQTWTGQIPDVFRASFTVALNGTAYGTYFGDSVGGQALNFSYTYNSTSKTFSANTGTTISPQILGPTTNGCDEYLGGQPNAAAPAVVTVAINHPYAANNGTYGDRTLTKQLVTQACLDSNSGAFYVTNDWGYVGSGIEDRIKIPASRQRTEPVNKLNMIFGPTLANVAHQYSEFLDLARWAQGNNYLLHDLIGVHTLDGVSNALTAGGQTTYDRATSLTMDFEGAVSAVSAAGTTASDSAAAFTAGFGLPLVEGAVPRQETDAVYDMASLSLLTQQASRLAGIPTDATGTVYLATPTTWSSVQPSLVNYPAAAISAIQGYINAGYSVLVPKRGDLREPPITVTITGSSATRTMQLWDGTNINTNGVEFKRSAFFAWHPTSGTNAIPDAVAMLVYDPRHGRVLKAGVGISIDSVSGTIRKPETPKAESKDVIRAAINVDGRTGHLKYSPAADLVDGVGEFPFSLSLQRAFDQTDAENYGMGIGWKNNWNQMATLSNDGSSALGGTGAQALGPALVMLTALGDLVQTQDAQHLHAAAQVAAWFTDQTMNNAAVITPGLDGERTYYLQANGTFAAANADGTSLVKSGTPVAGIINRWLYYPVSFTLTDRDGSTRRYPTQTVSSGFDISSPAIASIYSKKSLPMDRWSFPNGVVITTGYFNTVATSDIVGIYQVANNLGSSISMTTYDYGSVADFTQCEQLNGSTTWTLVDTPARPAKISYVTSAGASVTINMDAQSRQVDTPDDPPYHCTQGTGGGKLVNVDGTNSSISTSTVSSYANSVIDANGKTWAYTSHGFVTGLYGGYDTLTQIFKPTDAGTPDVTLTYGGDYNVRSLTDTANNVWNYYTNPFRYEIVSPVQAQAAANAGSVSQYDRYGQDVAEVDALGRSTSIIYDDLGRAVQKTRPAGDSVLTTYDARGNVLTSRRRPIGGTGTTDLTTTYTYVEGPSVVTCATPAICNKPQTEQDPLLFTTTYAWNPNGTLQSVTKPADASGVQPQTTLNYSTFTGTDSAALSLLTGKTEKISSTASTTTTYTRDAANKFNVSAATVDSATGGLKLRSCIKFDSAGNLISVSDPRELTCP